MIRNNIPSHKS